MPFAAYALLLTTMLFWGGNAVAGKLAVGHISPFLLVSLRWAMAVAILSLFAGRRLQEDWPVIRRNLPLLVGLGATGFTAFNATFYLALNYTSAINVAIEQAGMPVVIFAANFLIFRMRVTWLQLVGFILSLVGIAVATTHGQPGRLASLDVNFGDCLMLLAVLLYGGYTVALRLKPDIHWMSTITVLAVSALIASIPFALWEFWAGRTILPDAMGWGVTTYTALFPSLLAQVFFIRGNELIGGNRAGMFINLVPIIGTLLSIAILGEVFHLYHAVAIVTVLGGIWLAENSGRRHAAAIAAARTQG